MSEYRLIGFASFLCDAPGFLIPLFISRESNGVFSHLLDDTFRIDRFFWIEPSEYYVHEATDDHSYSIGSDGLLCFRSVEGDLYSGSVGDVKEKLLSLDIEAACDEFSMIDVYTLLGDEESKNSAIERAARLFPNPMIAESWRIQQLSDGGGHRSRGQIEVEGFPAGQREEVLRFSGALGGQGWVTQWLAYWRVGENKDFLSKVAMDWFARVGHIEGQTPVYRCLLDHEPIHHAAMVSLVDWLSGNGWAFPGWGRLWCVGFGAAKMDSEAERVLFDMGTEYLLGENSWGRDHSKTSMRLANVSSWCSVWAHITVDSREIDEDLTMRLMQLSGIYGKNRFFWQGALEPSLTNNIENYEFREILNFYLQRKGPNNGWIRIYDWLIQKNCDIHFLNGRVRELFRDDICASGTRYKVWEVLYRNRRKVHDLFVAATNDYVENFPKDSYISLVSYFYENFNSESAES